MKAEVKRRNDKLSVDFARMGGGGWIRFDLCTSHAFGRHRPSPDSGQSKLSMQACVKSELTCLSRCSSCNRTSETLRCRPSWPQAALAGPEPAPASSRCTSCTTRSKPAGWCDAASRSTAAADNTNCNCSRSGRSRDIAGSRRRRTSNDPSRLGRVIAGCNGRLGTRGPTCSGFADRSSFRRHSSGRGASDPVDRRRSRNLLQIVTMSQKIYNQAQSTYFS